MTIYFDSQSHIRSKYVDIHASYYVTISKHTINLTQYFHMIDWVAYWAWHAEPLSVIWRIVASRQVNVLPVIRCILKKIKDTWPIDCFRCSPKVVLFYRTDIDLSPIKHILVVTGFNATISLMFERKFRFRSEVCHKFIYNFKSPMPMESYLFVKFKVYVYIYLPLSSDQRAVWYFIIP